MNRRSTKNVLNPSPIRVVDGSWVRSFRALGITMEQLKKLTRLLVLESSSPQRCYAESPLSDWINPAETPRIETYDCKFSIDYLLYHMLRKYVAPSDDKKSLDRQAFSSFFRGERSCLSTNRRLRCLDAHDIVVNTFVMRVQDLIYQILGPLDIDAIVALSRFSSGATADLSLKESRVDLKYVLESPSVTLPAWRNFSGYLKPLNEGATGLTGIPVLVAGNRVLTVPKNNKTNRTIAAEPTFNMYFQLGVGSYLKKRLRRVGQDLHDQTVNQRLALKGSITGDIATLDLENASNSLAYETVRLLVPSDWFELFSSLRSSTGELPNGKLHRYQMFSSMGNGFTFELETLIFYAIARVASESRDDIVSVYGDDIVCSTKNASSVIHWLNFFGFKTNQEKTFYTGYFRESCGKHYYFGEDVSPFFVRRPVDNGFDLFLLHNNMVRWRNQNGFIDIRLDRAIDFVRDQIPEDSRLYGPDGYGDGHLLCLDECELNRSLFYNRNLQCLQFVSISRKASQKLAHPRGALCVSLLGGTKENPVSSYLQLSNQLKKIRIVLTRLS